MRSRKSWMTVATLLVMVWWSLKTRAFMPALEASMQVSTIVGRPGSQPPSGAPWMWTSMPPLRSSSTLAGSTGWPGLK